MRPIWTGSISFGLVNIPVRMFSGTHPQEGLDLDMLHREDHAPIRYARICRKDGQEIAWDDIVKGYEYADGDYVVLTEADFNKANPKKTQTVDIQQFVASTEIDIRYFEKPYYLEPIKGGEKAYALLRAALEQSDKLALARFVIHQKEHLGVIKPVGKALVLNQMRFPTDLREATNLKFPDNAVVTDKELDVAVQLIKQQTKHFIPEDFHDTYTEELEEIITAKTKGVKPSNVAGEHKPKDTTAADLMSTLKASLNQK
ncbi:MAG: Ku protein [Candidatus Saccharibacteria bacterium]